MDSKNIMNRKVKVINISRTIQEEESQKIRKISLEPTPLTSNRHLITTSATAILPYVV
jgi:hypothetical protein